MGHSDPRGETPLSLVGRPWEAATLPPHLSSQLGPSLGPPAVQLQCNVTPLHSGSATQGTTWERRARNQNFSSRSSLAAMVVAFLRQPAGGGNRP